jgi:hypothetical protein
MTDDAISQTDDWLTLAEAATLIERCEESIRVDGKLGLVVLTKRQGIRGKMIRLDRFNAYVKRKHGSRCKPISSPALQQWRETKA